MIKSPKDYDLYMKCLDLAVRAHTRTRFGEAERRTAYANAEAMYNELIDLMAAGYLEQPQSLK